MKISKTHRLSITFRRIILCNAAATTSATTVIHEDVNKYRRHRDKSLKKMTLYDRRLYSHYKCCDIHVIFTIPLIILYNFCFLNLHFHIHDIINIPKHVGGLLYDCIFLYGPVVQLLE